MQKIKSVISSLIVYLTLLVFPGPAFAVDLGSVYAFGKITSLGDLLSYLVEPALWIGGMLVSFYFFYAAIEMIYSHGDKNVIAAARDKMIHAIIGLLVLVGSFVIVKYLPNALGLGPIDIFNF